MYIRYILSIGAVFLASCSVSQLYPTTTIPSVPAPIMTGTISVGADIQTITVGTGMEESVELEMSGGVGYIKIDKSARAKIKVFFTSDADKTLMAELETPGDTLANVRISQIIYPDGRSDGPFGRNMQYILSQTGKYQLIISESLMAGNEWSGEAYLSVKIR